MRTNALAAAGVVSTAAVLAVAPAAALAAWTAPADLSAGGQNARSASLAVDDAGDAVFAWRRSDGTNDRIQAQTRSAAGVFGLVRTLSVGGQSAFGNQVAIDGAGNAVVTWLRNDGTYDIAQARRLSAAGVLGPILNLAPTGQDAVDPHVAVDFAGNAVFTWRRWDGANDRVYARTLSAAGAVGPIITLSAGGQDAIQPRVAMDANGDAAFIWTRGVLGSRRVQARSLSPAGVLSAVRTLSLVGQEAYPGDVAVDPAGNATFAWYAFNGTEYEIQTRAVSAAGVLSIVQTISDPGEFAYQPEVGVDAAGNAVFAWYRSDGSNWRVQTRTLSAAGVPGLVSTLSDAGEDAVFPHIAVNAAGDAVVGWQRSDGTNTRAEAATVSAAGAISAPTQLSAAGQNALSPPVGIDGAGNTIADWQRFDGTNDRIQFATGP
ncbi:hypothetical protein [Solirubrobacter soli]|uniref:hypothetical protein n=1 Tax=Solirubrobacter soli TaxID=363832 RepID=UPI0004839123|nr:hypothetical protein [Solirubrobacter soli]